MTKIIVSEQSEDFQSGYRYGYSRGRRNKNKDSVKDVTTIPPKAEWYGEADGYADGELVYDRWFCGHCGTYFPEWEDKPNWNFCPICGNFGKSGADMRGEEK